MAGGGVEELNECKFVLASIDFGWDYLLLWMTILGALSAVAEVVLHRLERFQVRQIYRELTILGMMSFVLIVVRDFSRTLTKVQFQIIEFAHLWIFSVGVSLVATTVTVAIVLRRSKQRWDESFAYGITRLEDRFNEARASRSPSWLKRTLNFVHRRREWRIKQQLRLWVLRKHFLTTHRLPASFQFAKFIRRTLTDHIAEDMEIGWQGWLSLCSIFFCGFVVASQLQTVDRKFNPEIGSLALFSISLLLLICSLLLYGWIELSMLSLLRLTGASHPNDFDALLYHARLMHEDEETDIVDPDGKLPADDFRLDQILREHRNKHSKSVEFVAKHEIFDLVNVEKVNEKKILITRHNMIFVNFFRLLSLGQSYTFGATLVLLSQDRYSGVVRSEFGVFVILEIVFHLTMVGFLFPWLLRNYSLLSAVTRIDDKALDLMDETFIYHQEVNESLYVLAAVLHTAYNGELEARRFDPGTATFSLLSKSVFKMLDRKTKGFVREVQLQDALERYPFRTYISERRLRGILRVLNCPGGLRIDQCRFLIQGMIRLEASDERKAKRYRNCFSGHTVTCHVCKTPVDVRALEAHSDKCRAKDDEGGRARRSSFEKVDSSYFARGAQYGLMRPFDLKPTPARDPNRSSVMSSVSVKSMPPAPHMPGL